VIAIKHGELGYIRKNRQEIEMAFKIAGVADSLVNDDPSAAVDALNLAIGVTRQMRSAMEIGSMFGWDIPGANPSTYKEDGCPIPRDEVTFSEAFRC